MSVSVNNLRHYREMAGMSQVELATKTGLDQGKISRAEAGGSDLKGQQWKIVADALGVSVDNLLGHNT